MNITDKENQVLVTIKMSLDLTFLDKGLARFLENDLILIFHANIPLEEFRNAANVLLSNLPVLGGKLNFLVSGSQSSVLFTLSLGYK